MVAFGPEQRDVVTAPSAAHLYCMRRLQRRGILKPPAEVSRQWCCMRQVHMDAYTTDCHEVLHGFGKAYGHNML